MDVKTKVITAQKEIINKLAACEEAISDLYHAYSTAMPEHKDFWQNLSNKEKSHASLLRSMHKQLDRGEIFHNIGRFSLENLDGFLAMIKDSTTSAEDNDCTELSAMEAALTIEASILDAHFYDIVKSDDAEYKVIADRLSKDTHSHAKLVREKLLEIQSKR